MGRMSLKPLTTSQVAKILDVTGRRVVQLAEDGAISFERTPLGRLYDADDVARIARERADRKAALATGGQA